MEILDRHHLSYNPPIIRAISHKEHQKIHGNVPVVNELSLKMRQYDKLVKLSTMMKLWTKAYQREFGQTPIDIGKEIEAEKKNLLKQIKPLVQNDIKKVKHIKGLGIRYLAGLLAYAHPYRFSSLRNYLYYCGRKGQAKKIQKYSRKASHLTRQVSEELVRKKDENYYPLYIKIKEDLKNKHPDFKRIRLHEMALNRIGTLLLKELYSIFHDGEMASERSLEVFDLPKRADLPIHSLESPQNLFREMFK